MRDTLKELKKFFSGLSLSQKITLAILVVLVIVIPISVVITSLPTNIRSKAAEPISNPVTPTPHPLTPPEQPWALFNNGYITPFNSESINPKLGFTVEAWIKPLNGEFTSSIFFSKKFAIMMQSETDPAESDKYRVYYSFFVASNSLFNCSYRSISEQILFPKEDFLNNWQHIAGVIQDDGKMDIFVNGKRSEMNFNSIYDPCSINSPIAIGTQLTDSTPIGYFSGLMDEIKISNVAQYVDNFFPEHTYVINPNDILFYPFNYGNEKYDATGNEHNAIISGSVTFVPSPTVTPTKILTPSPTPTPTRISTPKPTKRPPGYIGPPVKINDNY